MRLLISAKFLTCASCALLALTLSQSPLAAQVANDPAAPPPTVVPVEPAPNPPVTSPAEPERVLLPAGTVISVRIADRVDSSHLHSGDLLTGIVDPSLIYNDRVLIPRGTEAHVRMLEDKKGGHLHGKAEVELELVGLVMNGRQLELESDTYKKEKGAIAAKVQGEAAPAAGAGTNAAAGTDPGSAASPVIAIFRAARVDLIPNTRIEFRLTSPFTFVKPPEETSQR